MQTDKEIENKIIFYNSQLENIKFKIKTKKLFTSMPIMFIIFIIIIIHSCIFAKGLNLYIEDGQIVGIITIMELMIIIFLISFYEQNLQNKIEKLEKEKECVENKKEKTLDFLSYLTACRHLKELQSGENIYPELFETDSKWIYNEYKNEFEEKRVKYENGKRIQVLCEIAMDCNTDEIH